MANLDVPHGFKPWGELLRARLYAVPTAPTINIAIGDLVTQDNVGGIVTAKLGLVATVYDAAVIAATIGDAMLVIGSVLACFDENMDPIDNAPAGYIAAARVGDGTVAGYVLIADHPSQQFEAQADTALSATDLDLNYEVTSVALSAPDTYTGISTQEIAVAGAAVTSTIPIRLYGQAYPQDDVYSAAGCRMVCQINPLCHLYGAGTQI